MNALLELRGTHHADDLSDDVAFLVNQNGGGNAADAIGIHSRIERIVEEGEGVALLCNKISSDLAGLLVAIGHVDHHKLDLIAINLVCVLKIRHFCLAGAAPRGRLQDEIVCGGGVGLYLTLFTK